MWVSEKCFGFEFEFSRIWFEEFGKSFKENVLVWGFSFQRVGHGGL